MINMTKSLKRFLLQKERELYDKFEEAEEKLGLDNVLTDSYRSKWCVIYQAICEYYPGFVPDEGKLVKDVD